MKVLFFGTPSLSAEFLARLHENGHHVVGVVTQPDRPVGRGQRLQPPPVKTCAAAAGIPVFQPEKFTADIIERLRDARPDVGVVVAYGNIIPQTVFSIPCYGCFNIHFSLLPRYRGAAPVQWALINGEKETGVSTFWLEKTLDSGPILVQKTIAIEAADDTLSLFGRLVPLGIEAMKETLTCVHNGRCTGIPQQGDVTYAPALKKEDGAIDWSQSAVSIMNRIRGTRPWPGAYTAIAAGAFAGKTVKIITARIGDTRSAMAPGQLAEIAGGNGFVVGCGQGTLVIEEVHPENKRPMSAADFLRGSRVHAGDILFSLSHGG